MEITENAKSARKCTLSEAKKAMNFEVVGPLLIDKEKGIS
jgi:hypothetical protein